VPAAIGFGHVSPTDLRQLLAANVRASAEAKGVSLNKLADLAGISRPTMHFLLTARSSVGIDTIAKLADALDLHPALLLRPAEPGARRAAPRPTKKTKTRQ
jgi:transcriptional regulator with XRE-family HTH domain